jgi:hypothetical protein
MDTNKGTLVPWIGGDLEIGGVEFSKWVSVIQFYSISYTGTRIAAFRDTNSTAV